MVIAPQFQLSTGPSELPTFNIKVDSRDFPFLVDTGATLSCINQSGFSKYDSGTSVSTVGIAGVLQKQPVTKPLQVEVNKQQLQHPFLLGKSVPLSLMGRDLLCKLNAKIFCSPSGVVLNIPTEKVQQFFSDIRPEKDKSSTNMVTANLDETFMSLQEIKRLSKCCASAAIILLTLKPVIKPFAISYTETNDTSVNLQYLYLCPLGLVLVTRIGEENINIFVLAVRNGVSDIPNIVESLSDHINRIPVDKEENNDYVVWSYGAEYSCFFIRRKNIESLTLNKETPSSEIELKPASVLSQIPNQVWAREPNESGLLQTPAYDANIDYSKFPVYVKQYPLSKEKEEGIAPVIESLLKQGVILKKKVACNSPINPVVKPGTNKWRLTLDLRKVNDIVFPITPTVPDINAILTSLSPQSKFYSTVDLTSAYHSVTITQKTKELFGFEFRGEFYCLNRLSMGFVDSAAYFCKVVHLHLSHLKLPGNSTLSLYFDDLLISSTNETECIRDSIALLCHLAEGGHKVSLAKMQFCQTEVNYLGYVLKDGCRFLSKERTKIIMDMKRPRTKKELLSFLGLVNYSRQWLVNYASFDNVLRKATLKGAPETVIWTEDMKHAFRHIKYLMSNAPALGLPDYTLPFHLYVSNDSLCTCAVLAQTHGDQMRPVAFLSKALPLIVQGMVPCLRAVASSAMMVEKAQTIVLTHPLTLHTTHTISIILNNITTQHMTTQRKSNYEHILLSTENLNISTATHTNPALHLQVLLHGQESELEEDPHDCMQLIEGETSVRMDLKQTPLTYSDMTLFCDGSAMRPDDNTVLAGYAVVDDQQQCIEAYRLPVRSAQAAELIALSRACKIAKDKRANIYCDSKFAWSTANDFGKIWELRGFITSAGKEIQHANLVKDLLESMMLPTELAIIKCKAHLKNDTFESKGNNFADKCAREAALSGSFPPWQNEIFIQTLTADTENINPPFSKEELIRVQDKAPISEKRVWEKRKCFKDENGLWKSADQRIVLPNMAQHPLIAYIHGIAHNNYKSITMYIEKLFFAVGLEKHVKQHIQQCIVCARCNPAVRPAKHEHLPLPEGPFQQLQIDFTHMPKCRGYSYVLSIIDKFSKWPECYATRKENAQTVVKCLLEHIVPRFGIPVGLDSDRGSTFTGKVTRLLATALGIKWSYHVPYTPTSSGLVERLNRTIKDKILKIHMSRKMTWLDALPIALMSIRAMPSKATGLSPHEILMGRPFPLAAKEQEMPADLTNLQESQQQYVHNMYKFVARYLQQVSDVSPVLSEKPTHPFKPGDVVLVRSLKPTTAEPRYGPPVKVLLVTRTAVKVKGTPSWVHASRIKAAPGEIEPQAPT